MIYLIIFHCPQLNYCISTDVLSQYNFFRNTQKLFENHEIIVKYFYDFLSDDDKEKYINMDINYKYDKNDLIKEYYNDVDKIFSIIIENNVYHNSIMVGWEPIGFDVFFHTPNNKQYAVTHDRYNELCNKNIKIILVHFDVHGFNIANIHEKAPSTRAFLGTNIVTDYRLDKCSLFISPTIQYFKNINCEYANKIEFMPFSYDDSIIDEISDIQQFDLYFNREKKIVLNGALSAYRYRKLIYELIVNNHSDLSKDFLNFENHTEFKKILHHMPYNIINRNSKDPDVNGGMMYLSKLSKYMGAFVIFGDFPIDFPIAKLWEIMLAGCLAFIQHKEFLKKEIGLIPYVHYVPILISDDDKIILDIDYYNKYLGTDLGFQIAKKGSNYICEFFSDSNNVEKYVNILKKHNLC